MPHKELNYVQAPVIYPIRKYMDLPETFITTDTRIELHTDTPDTRIFFTSDGSEPDPYHRTQLAKQKTHKYKGPFSLLAGTRTVRALAVTKTMRFKSHITTRTFIVRDSFALGVDLNRPNDEGSVVSLASNTDSELTIVSQDINLLEEERLLRALHRQRELDPYAEVTGHSSIREAWLERERSRESMERARSPGILRDTERPLSDRVGLGSARVHFASYDSYQHAAEPSARSARSYKSVRSHDSGLDTRRLMEGYEDDARSGRSTRPARPVHNNFIDEEQVDLELAALEAKQEQLRRSREIQEELERIEVSPRDKNGRTVSPPTVSTYRKGDKPNDDDDDAGTYIISDADSKKSNSKDKSSTNQKNGVKKSQKQEAKKTDKVKDKDKKKKVSKEKVKRERKDSSSSSSSSTSSSESGVSSVPSSAAAMSNRKEEKSSKENVKGKSKSKSKFAKGENFNYWGMSPEEVIQSIRMSSQAPQPGYPHMYQPPMMGPQMVTPFIGPHMAQQMGPHIAQQMGPQMGQPQMGPHMAQQMGPQMPPQMIQSTRNGIVNGTVNGAQLNGNMPQFSESPRHSRHRRPLPESSDGGETSRTESTAVSQSTTASQQKVRPQTKSNQNQKPVRSSTSSKLKGAPRPGRTASLQDFLGDEPQESSRQVSAATEMSSKSGCITATSQSENQFLGGLGKKVKKFFKGWGPDNKGSDSPEEAKTVGRAGSTDGKVITYEEILKKCQKSKKLWEDPHFPASDASLYLEGSEKDKVEWKRPHEISQNPEFFVGGASRLDVNQGVLGNCWLLAAVSSLASDEQLFARVVPAGQSFKDKYCGVFRFRMWQYGSWVEVCVDDRLPTRRGKLLYMHSESQNEFWSALLEKAYAKLCGCYEALTGGLASEAMTDFTGGFTERFNFREEVPDNMFQILSKAKERRSLMGCSIDAKPDQMEAQLDNGLIMGHAYSITDVNTVKTTKGPVNLVRVRNPWGNSAEWNGPWGDRSKEWQSIPEEDRKKIGLAFEHDGEFWMSFKDFVTHFQRVEICNIVLGDYTEGKKWQATLLEGSWIKKVNAGGCRNHPGSYSKNPQYRVMVTDPDEDDEEEVCTVIVGLMQKDRRKLRCQGKANLTIGFDIYDVSKEKSKDALRSTFFSRHGPVASAPQYINMREVCGRYRLPPGEYCIIPTTFEPNEEGSFIIRVFTEKESDVREVDSPTGLISASQDAASVQLAPITAALEADLMEQAEQQFESRCGEDKQIDAYELQTVLNDTFTQGFDFGGFDINLCRSMVALRDVDQSGMLGFEEFKILWEELRTWKNVYKQYDTDNSGHFNSLELREALKSVGYATSNATFKVIAMRFSDRQGYLKFDDFVACIIKLKSMFGIFKLKTQDQSASFELDEFIQMTMYS